VALVASFAFMTAGCVEQKTNFFAQDSHFEDVNCRAVANDRANDAGIWVTVDRQR
jgi:hypothetical protein